MIVVRKVFGPLLCKNTFFTSRRQYQVTLVGGANEIGQTTSLLLRAQPSISKLVFHDTQDQTPGIVLDLSHIPTNSILTGYTGEATLDVALKNADLILATGGTIRKPGITKESWFSKNSQFIKSLALKIAKLGPMPFVGIATEPINALVPMAAEIMRNHGDYDSKKLFGITTMDHFKAQTLYANENELNPHECILPVIGGHSEMTMVPLISQSKPVCSMSDKTIHELTSRIRSCEAMVTKAKKGWSPTLSVAYGVLMFTRAIMNAIQGDQCKVNAYIENNDFGTSYFSGLVTVNQKGAGEMERYNNLSKYECYLLERSIAQIREDVLMAKKMLEYA